MRKLLLVLCCLLTVPALANPVDQARGAHVKAGRAHVQALARQRQARAAHEQIVRQIQARKAQATRNVLGVRDPVLDGLLKEGHDLAQTVALADRAVAQAQAQLATQRATLVKALDIALSQTNQAFAQSSGPQKRELFSRLQALSAERARLQAAGHSAQRPQTVQLPEVADGASAEELRELADEASDNAERVRKQLTALEQRLSALTMRRRLLRVERTLDGDLSLFGDDERNRQVARSGRLQAADGRNQGNPEAGTRTAAPEDDTGQAAAPPLANDPGNQGEGGGQPGGSPDPAVPPAEGMNADNDDDGAGLDDFAEVGDLTPPEATVPQGLNDSTASGNAVVFEASLDPNLLTEDVDSLGPAAVAEQLQALRKKQAQLRKAAEELARRRAALEEKAETLDNE